MKKNIIIESILLFLRLANKFELQQYIPTKLVEQITNYVPNNSKSRPLILPHIGQKFIAADAGSLIIYQNEILLVGKNTQNSLIREGGLKIYNKLKV